MEIIQIDYLQILHKSIYYVDSHPAFSLLKKQSAEKQRFVSHFFPLADCNNSFALWFVIQSDCIQTELDY